MSFLCDDNYVSCAWTIGDNSDYDKDIWDLIFEEEGIECDEELYFDPELGDSEWAM